MTHPGAGRAATWASSADRVSGKTQPDTQRAAGGRMIYVLETALFF
jgi:hypothetical protein